MPKRAARAEVARMLLPAAAAAERITEQMRAAGVCWRAFVMRACTLKVHAEKDAARARLAHSKLCVVHRAPILL